MTKSTGFTRKALLDNILGDEKLIEVQKLLKAYCIPYATSQGREEWFGNPAITELDFEDFRTGTWIIGNRGFNKFANELWNLDVNTVVHRNSFWVYDGLEKSDSCKTRYILTPYGIVREVPHDDFTDKYIKNSDGKNGYWQLNPEFLVDSYKRKDVLFYVPTYAIGCMERWTTKRMKEKDEKRTKLDELSRKHYGEEKEFRHSMILKGGNTPEIEKLVNEMMDFVSSCCLGKDDLHIDIKQLEDRLRTKLKATPLGEEVFDHYEYMVQQQIKARSELRTALV